MKNDANVKNYFDKIREPKKIQSDIFKHRLVAEPDTKIKYDKVTLFSYLKRAIGLSQVNEVTEAVHLSHALVDKWKRV